MMLWEPNRPKKRRWTETGERESIHEAETTTAPAKIRDDQNSPSHRQVYFAGRRLQVAGWNLIITGKPLALKVINNRYTRQGFLDKVVRLFRIVNTRLIRYKYLSIDTLRPNQRRERPFFTHLWAPLFLGLKVIFWYAFVALSKVDQKCNQICLRFKLKVY